ncbi:hypothetical protein APUTEX25_004785 [Auxenochlorella protothecoides]|uniref:Right handed beta helix domain-containing protein n=1 Tax=Auxenochlorella protothecoides TaxID=3075 RepID=A0A3M7KSG0_AUXPR|nr:hypothetical protein APUTEX25_004785 [Auxenochlorella protothecoides]|eukprot:RMZ53297.1 hypothetical protein APUTEX25_004785 [Auxenochlorella protothecoides]
MVSKPSSPVVRETEVSDSSDDELESCTTPGPSMLRPSTQAEEEEVEGTLHWDAGSHRHAPDPPCAHWGHRPSDAHRAAGNAALAAGDCAGALRHYALGLAEPSASPRDTAVLHCNMAAAHLRLGAAAKAAAACERAHQLRPDWHKPLFRLARARQALGQWAAAAAAARRGTQLAGPADVPSFQALQDEVAVSAFVAGSLAGFGGARLEVRSAGDEAWLGGPAPHDPHLDGPETTEPGEVVKYLPAGTGACLQPPAAGIESASLEAKARSGGALVPAEASGLALKITGASQDLAEWRAPSGPRRTSFRSLKEAVAAAEDGDIIVLLAGVHNGMGEAVTVSKRLLIQGQGRLGDAVIDQRANSPTFRLGRGGVVLHNLTLDQTGFKETLCVSGPAGAGGPLILGCMVKCSGDDAVNVCQGAAPLFVDCELTARKSGVRAFDSAAPRLLRCTIEKCGEAGVKLLESAKCDLTDCIVQKCEEEGLVAMDSALLTCSQTVVTGCKGPGVDLSDRASATLVGGAVQENVGGVWLWDQARAQLSGVRLEGGPSHAVMVFEEGAELVAEDCAICGTLHGPEGVLQAIPATNTVAPPGRHTGWPLEDGPFQFVPNRFTRKQ